MLEVTPGVVDADRRKRFAQHVYQSILGTGSCSAQNALDLGKRFLYRIEIRRVGRQVDQLATLLFDQFPHPGRFVRGEVLSRITTSPACSVGARAYSM